MKKTTFILFIASAAFLSLLYNCSDDESTVEKIVHDTAFVNVGAYDISGTVTGENNAIAGGAMLVLSTKPNAAEIVAKTVSDTAGKYMFGGVSDGTYYLSAMYNTENTNNMMKSGYIFTTATDLTITVNGADVAQDISLVSNAATGSGVVDITNGWTYDNTHSTIGFKFMYDVENAEFSGHFAEVGLNEFIFKEADLASSKIDAWVKLTSVETGSPSYVAPDKYQSGRDGVNGCIRKTFGVTMDENDTVAGLSPKKYNETAPIDSTNMATFKSTDISKYGDGFVAKGKFKFHAMESDVDLYFHYIEGFEKSGAYYSSFAGMFIFNALADHNISSGHVGNTDITVITNLQFNKKP